MPPYVRFKVLSIKAVRHITYLLSETDTRAGVEGKEDEGVRREVLGNAFIQETIRIEGVGYKLEVSFPCLLIAD